MWQVLMDWLPDLRVGTFEIRDLASLIVAGLGAFLAYLAIKLGKEQAAIAKRQGEITEQQYQMQAVSAEREATVDVYFDDDVDYDGAVKVRNMGIAPLKIESFVIVIYVGKDTVEFIAAE